jgi:hypothetical protein
MKITLKTITLITLLLIINVYSFSISYASTKNNNHNKITIEDIHKELSKNETVILRKFKEKYVLAEVRNKLAFDKGSDVEFILYNLKTGEKNIVIDDSKRDLKLDRIEDENNILISASGETMETAISFHSIHLFPYLIRCMRPKNFNKPNCDFIQKRELAFFSAAEDIKFGDESYSIISNGIQKKYLLNLKIP